MPPALDPANRQNAATFLRDLAVSPVTAPALLLAWAALLMLGGQLPQVDAPLSVADGLTRADHLTLHGFGLDRLGISLPLMLLSAATAITAAARLLFPRSLAISFLPRDRPTAGDPLVDLEMSLKHRGFRRVRRRDRRLTVGFPVQGAWLLGVGALLAVAAWVSQATAPLPVWTDVQLGAGEATWPAWTADPGGLAPAAGRWAGACERLPAGNLRCQVQVPGGRGRIELARGGAAAIAGREVAWVGSATGLSGLADVRLRWLVAGRPWLLQLESGAVGESAELHARLQPFATRTAGPLVVVHQASGISILSSPQLAGPGARLQAATLQRDDLIRLQWSTPTYALELLGMACLACLLGAVLAWVVPVLRVEVDDDGLAVRRCNRAKLLRCAKDAWLRADLAPTRPAP